MNTIITPNNPDPSEHAGTLITPKQHPDPHRCKPPIDIPPSKGRPFVISGVDADRRWFGTQDGLWICECGQHWRARGHQWRPISERRFCRALRKIHSPIITKNTGA